MKEIFGTFSTWWRMKRHEWKRKRDVEMMRRLWKEAERKIQVREWEGGVYVCYDGVPLLDRSDLSHEFTETLSDMRRQWVAYVNDGRLLVSDFNR